MYYRPGDSYGVGVLMSFSLKTVFSDAEFKVDCFVSDAQWKQNCYLVENQRLNELILIDPGEAPDEIIRLILASGTMLKRILITHPHHDHIGAASVVSDYFNIPCELHKADIRLMKQAPMYAQTFAGKNIFAPNSLLPFEGDSFIVSDDSSLRVLHTPGHTKGSVCYLFAGFAFTGDTLLYRHVGRTDLPGGDDVALASSLTHLLKYLPEETLLLPGHGSVWTAGDASTWWQQVCTLPPQHDRFNTDLGGETEC